MSDLKREKSKSDAAESESKSPVAALDELIAALGKLPPSTEEVIAKLKNQVNFLIQVRFLMAVDKVCLFRVFLFYI